jgi:hypothetical protein
MRNIEALKAARAPRTFQSAQSTLRPILARCYGSAGATDQLDFSVISPAINEVARIEGLREPLDQAVSFSAKFVAATLCAPQGAERGLRDGFWALGIHGPSSKASGSIKNAKPHAAARFSQQSDTALPGLNCRRMLALPENQWNR